ncbi:MAG: Stp1/IreP family PP2C-type Ser/Thr phosphatase [bacterium]
MIDLYGQTDIGNFRVVNQDRIAILKNDQEALAVVCDGMGGHKAGEVASKMACQIIEEAGRSHPDFQSEEDIKNWLYLLVDQAHMAVNEAGTAHIEYEGMGTTVVLAFIYQNRVYISHVGDSRAYLIDDTLKQVTTDDTLANALVESGFLSREAAAYYPQKNILVQALGVSLPIKVSYQSFDLPQYVLLCTDGLYNSLTDEQMYQIIHDEKNVQDAVASLIAEAKKYGGYDNIGLILIERK